MSSVSVHSGGRRRRGRVIGALCAVAASAVVVSGCGDGGQGKTSAAAPTAPAQAVGQTTPGGLTRDQTERQALVTSAKIGWDEAADTALAKVPGSKLSEIKLKRAQAGTPEWESEIAAADGTAHDVHVDAASGQVTQSRVESDQDNEDRQQLADRLSKAKITPQQAATTATDRKQGTVIAVGLEGADSRGPIWSVDVVTKNDGYKTAFDIDAVSGEVLREEVDRD